MNQNRSLAFALALAVLAIACGGNDATVTTRGGDIGPMIRFDSGDHPFAISYPEDWETERDSFGAVIIMFSPLSGVSDQFSENVNVVIEDLAGADITLDEYVDLAVEQLIEFIPDIDISDEFPDEMDTQPSWVIAYTGTQDGVEYNWVQEIALFDGSAYIITYTGGDEFDTYLVHAAEIFSSFDFRE